MKRTLTAISAAIFLASSPASSAVTQSYRASNGQMREALPQVLVKYKEGRSAAVKSGLLRQMGAAPAHAMGSTGIDVVNVPAGQTLQSFLDRLKQDPDIEFVEPNGIWRALDNPNDPDFQAGSQYSLGSGYIDAKNAWDISTGSPTVVVAVIDTGISLTHQDLDGSLWDNPSPSGNSGAHGTKIFIDWNGDGDCLDTDPDLGPEQCASGIPLDDNNPEFHGSRVSGIIAAETNNGLNMAGIARGVKIMAIKALTSDGVGSFEGIATGIRYAVDNGAQVINMSLGGDSSSDAVVDQVAYATAHNVVIVAASGNSGNSVSVNFPGAIPAVIAVGATDASNNLAFFSCTGSALDLVAPGVGILSTIPPNTTSASGGDGTSFSSPMVAATAALILSVRPNATVSEVTNFIDYTATDLGTAGYDTAYGFGLLNVRRAVLAAQTGTVPTSTASPGDSYPYPNPFHPAQGESVTFSLPTSFGTDGLEIKVFNLAGEKIKTLNQATWNGRNDDGNFVASGLYFYYAKTSKGNVKGKVSVIK